VGRNRRWEHPPVRFCPGSLAVPAKHSCSDPCAQYVGSTGCRSISSNLHVLHQQKNGLLKTNRARVQRACVRRICSVRPKLPPLRPVCPERPGRPERPGVLGLDLLRLVPPNTLVPNLTTWCSCHGLIRSEYPPSVSSRPAVSRLYLPDSPCPPA